MDKALNIILNKSYKFKTEVEKLNILVQHGIMSKYKIPNDYVGRPNYLRYSLYDIKDMFFKNRRPNIEIFRERINEEFEKLIDLNDKLVWKKNSILENLKKLNSLSNYEDINKRLGNNENLQLLKTITSLINETTIKEINSNKNYLINKIIDIEPEKLEKLLSIKSKINLEKLKEISNIDKDIKELENQALSLYNKNSKISFDFKLKEVYDLEKTKYISKKQCSIYRISFTIRNVM